MKGLRMERKKEYVQAGWALAPAKNPSRIWLSFLLSAGHYRMLVREGDAVKAGQKIADPISPDAAAIYSSVSGRVNRIGAVPHPRTGEAPGIEIITDEHPEPARVWAQEREGWQELSKANAAQELRDLGVVTLDESTRPLHRIILESRLSAEDTLVINGCQPEPYLTASFCLILSHPIEMLKGADTLKKLCGAGKILFVLESDQEEAAEVLRSKIYFLKWPHAEVRVLPAQYPQPIRTVLESKPAMSKVPSARMEIHSAHTVFALYEALAKGKPLMERAVSLSGECLSESKNAWVKIGAPADETLKQQAKGFLREPRKLVMGGPMSGLAIRTYQTPVLFWAEALLALPKEVAKPETVEACIRCRQCDESCPAGISPMMITWAAEQKDFETARAYGVDACIECGNCAYVCPSKRPLMEWISEALAERLETPFSEAGKTAEQVLTAAGV